MTAKVSKKNSFSTLSYQVLWLGSGIRLPRTIPLGPKVLGTDIVGMEVHTEGNGLAVLKMLISAMATNKQLNKLIKAAVAADKFLHVEAVKLNMKNSEEKGGEV